MKVGTICKLKVDCLGNIAGTLGVVFHDYGDGFQAIFENGNYDGFSRTRLLPSQLPKEARIEANYFLEEVGFEESLAGYQFKNVMQVAQDYRDGLFDIAWSEGWKKQQRNPMSDELPEKLTAQTICGVNTITDDYSSFPLSTEQYIEVIRRAKVAYPAQQSRIEELEEVANKLSMWAAAIHWNGKKNTQDWMDGLKKQIEKVEQALAKEKSDA